MSTAFNLTAQLNLRGPTNVRNIVSSIRRQLGTISADVNLRIDPAANRNLTQLNSALNTFNTTLRTTQSNVNNTTNALRGLATAIGAINSNGLPRNMTAMATSANRAAQATSRVTTQVEASRNQMEEFGRQSALAIRRFAAFSLSTGIIFGFTNALNKGLKAFVDFDKELVKLQQVTGESAQGLAGLQKTISSLSTGLGVSSSELINVSSTLAQAGLSARDTEKALRALALSSLAPSFDDMNKTVEGSIALMRQFGISAGELDQALGSVNAVAAKFAVEASDIIAAIQRTGGVFAAASKGVSEGTQALNEFIAVFTSIRATTRESAETIATGLRTIFTRVQRGETIEALKQYGVNLTDLEGKFVGAYKAVELLSRGLNTIDPRDLRFSQIVEELGGFRQIGKVIPLIQQFATAQQALAVAQRGQGSLAEDAAIAQLSLANQISKVREEFLTLIRDIGGTDTFQTIAKSALGLASALIKVADSVKGIIPVLGVVMAIRGTAALSSYARGFAGGLRGAPRRGAAKGGIIKYARGGDVDVALMPGEAVVYPEAAKRIGTPTLRRMNYADRKKYAKGGGVGVVPGSGNSDSFYTTLPAGSFVIRKKATEAMGINTINKIASGRQKFSYGGKVQKFAKAGEVKVGKTDGGGGVFMHLDPGPIIKGLFGNNGPKARGLTSIGITLGGIGPEWNQLLKKNKANISREELISLIQNTDPEELFSRQLQRSKNGKKARTGAGTFSGGTLSEAYSALSNQEVQQKLKSAIIDSASRLKYPIQGDKDLYPLGKALVDAAPPIMKKALAEIREYVYTDKSKGRERRKKALEESKTTGKVRRTTSEIRRRFSSKTLKQIQEGGARVVAQRGTNRLSIPRFSKGGITERNVGYIDSDEISGLLKDPVKGPLIKAEMDRLEIKGVADFKEHLSNLAASRRKSGDLKRLTNIFGVAGSGKSTMVQGGSRAKEADNAKLRKTTRYPILTEADLLRSDQVIDSTSVAGPSQRNALSSADRIIALSSRTKDSQEILKRQRKARDTSGKNLFGRKPGATKSAPLDSGIGEAYIAASEVSGVDSRKVRTLKIGENFKKTRTNQPSVRTPDKTGLFYGNFGPATAGHADAILEASKKAGIPTKDFVALVGGDTPIDPFSKDPHDRRTALFPQKAEDNRPSRVGMAKSVFGAIGANVSAMPRGSGPGSIPPAFKIGDDNYIVPKGTGDVAVVGDEKDPKSLDKYTKLGYKTMSLPRLGGISGTKAREAIANNDIPSLKKLLTKEGFDYVQQHIQTLQKRPQLIDAILDRIQKNSDKGRGVAGRLSSTKSALSELPSRVTKTTPPEIATKIESLRKDREALSSKLGRLPSKLVSRLEKRQRFGRGSTKPLKPISEMRRSELMDEARSKGISYDYELLGLRRPLTADESARKAKFLKDLEDSRIVTQEQAAKTSARAKKRNIAVVGITGDNDAQEIVTPGIKSKRGKKGMSGVPATLQTGTLPPEIAKKVQAIIRNRSERIVSAVASVIAGAAGTTQVKDRKGIRSILSKQLPDISGLLFESGLAAAGAPYDPSSKAIDFNKGLGKELAGLFGIDPKALTDATNDATQEQARRKVKKGQFDRGRRDAIRAKKAKTPRQKFGKGGLAFTDFDMTAAISKQQETPSLSGFKNPSLAVPDIMNASPTGLLKLLRQDYGGVGVLTARSGGPKGEMKKALQTFFKKNGIMVPASRLITLGDQIEDVPTPEKKARELHRLVKKYGRFDYFDDREDIVGAAKEVKGVNARRIKVRRAVGGSIPSPLNNTSLSRSSKDKRLDPKKLAAFLGGETPMTKKQQELLEQLKDKTSVISKPNYEELLKGLDPKKYARGGEVPIMAKEGEYIINRQSARAIGYGNLHRLNKYHSGGKVQKFARGGKLRDINDNIVRGGINYTDSTADKWALRQKEADVRKKWEARDSRRQDRKKILDARAKAREAITQMPVISSKPSVSRQQLSDFTIKQAGSTEIKQVKDQEFTTSGKVLSDRAAAKRVIEAREQAKIKAENKKSGITMSDDDVASSARKRIRANRGAELNEIQRSETSAKIFSDQAARPSINRAESTDSGKIAKQTRDERLKILRAEQKQLKAFTSLSAADQLDRINKRRAAAGKASLTSAQLQQRIDAKSAALSKGITVAKTNYRNTIVDIAKDQIQSGTREQGGKLTTRQDRIEQAASQRAGVKGSVAGVPRTVANPGGFMRAARIQAGRASNRLVSGLKDMGLISLSDQDKAANDQRAAYKAQKDKTAAAKAKKASLVAAGFGKGGAGSTAILSGRAAQAAPLTGSSANTTLASRRAGQQASAQLAQMNMGGTHSRRGSSGGGGRGGRRRGSSGTGSPQGGDSPNGRVMGMGRLTQAGFGISMMGGLGSQFFNPESSASNAANAAFTESFTSTIGMGATVAGSIGDLLPGRDDDNNKKKKRSKGSRNRGPSTSTRPPASPPSGGGGSRGGSGGGGRRGSGGPRVPSGGGSGGGGGGMGMLGNIGGVLAGVAVVGLAVAEGLKAAHNAAREFAINLANTKLEESLEKANKSVEKFSKNLKDKVAESKAKQDTLGAIKAADSLDAAYSKPEAGLFNLGDAMSGGEGSFERSQILNKKGIGAYLSTTSLFAGANAERNQAGEFSTLIPQLASEKAKRYTGAAETSTSFLESKFRSGSSIDDIKKDKDQFDNLTKSLALADAAVQQQIMTVQNSTTLNDTQKATLKNNIIATNAETKAREIQTKVLREMALESLNKTTIILQNSLERMFQNMEQAIASNSYALDKLTASADLASASLSGSAKVGSVKLDSINSLQNPRANTGQPMKSAVDQAASMFGNEAPAMKAILQVASNMEDAVMSTINSTLKNNPGATNELIGGSIDKSIFKVLTDLKLPPDLSSKLSSEVGLAIKDMRKSGEDKVDFSQIVEKIPQLGKVLDSAKRAQEVAIKSLENWQNALNDYANTTNQLIDIQIDSNQKLRRATDILVNGQTDLAKALGKSISLQSTVNDARAKTASQTGGPTDPGDIRRNVQKLELTRQSEQARADTASQKGFGGKDEFMMMQDRLRSTSVALRENYDALKNMAENTDVASAALNKISEIKQQRQAGVGFAEKLVSSTPRELANLNMSMARLQNNMAGGMNVSNAGQRAGDLQLFNELAPLLGDKQSEMKANVLESMLKESGVGVSPMMQDVIDSLRNPEADPAMQEAIATYREAIGLQAEANKQLVFLNTQMAENNADIAAAKLTQSMRGVVLKFESQQLLDINNSIKNLISVVEGKGGIVPAPGKANGGIIYASAGQMVNFEPKGTDTVPAMLTPGEFVVNRKSTQKHLPLLKSINSNKYSNGGKVGYYAYGGLVFGDPWQREDKADALNRSATIENETPDRYPDLLKNSGKSKGDLSKYFEEIFSVQGSFYATNKNAGAVSDWFFDKFTGSFSGLDPQAVLGSSYSELVAAVGGGRSDNIKVKRPENVNTPKIGNIPTLEFFSDIVSTASEQKKIKESAIKEYSGVLENILKFMPKADLSGDSIKIDGKNIIIDSAMDPKSRPTLSPKVTVSGKADRYGQNQQFITISNLAKKTGNLHGLYSKNNIDTIIANSNDMGSIGNIYGIQQDLSTASMIGEVASFGIAPGVRKSKTQMGIQGDQWTKIVAGLDSMKNVGGSNDIGRDSGLASGTTNFDNPMFYGDMANIKQRLADAQAVRANLEKVKEALSGGGIKLQESEASESNRNYVNKLQQLLSGSVFKATFSEAEIQGKDSVKPPITLYNLDGNDWDSRVDVLNADPSVTKGTYAGKKGGSWIPVGSRTMGVGSVPDRFDIQKWFPWISSGFNSTIFDDLKNKYNAQNPNNVKITPGSYSDELMAFNYKNIEGPMFDANKKMTKGKYKFTTVSLDPGITKEPLNPFKDLADQKLLPQDPERSEIYAKNSADLVAMVRNLVNNTILKTPQNTLSFGNSIKTLSATDPAIANLDFAQQTKDNAYLLNSVAPGFQYEAKLYGDELRKKIAKQRQDNQAAAGEKGIANKANIADQDVPENPLLLVEQARGIVGKVLAPISGILSAYNIKLAPIRMASQITPYGTRLLDAQKFFASSVTEKFKNNKKPIDQRLWDVWGALGATGKVFQKLGEGDKQGLQTLLGAAAGTLGNTTSLGDMVIRYGQLLAAQGSTFSGIAGLPTPEQALDKEIGDNDKQTIEGIFKKAQTEEATVAKDGKLTVNKTEGRNLPTTLLDLGKKIVNPYSTFQAADRSSLFDVLIKGLARYDNKNIKRNVNEKLVSYLQSLRNFYFSYLDPIVSGGIVPDVSMTQRISDQYPSMNGILQVLTNGEYGKMPDAKKMQELAAAKKARMEAQKKATGGIIYASTGTLVNYQPRGTDTVPAMLTPGEFVVNRAATQRNLPLLKAINSGSQSQSPKTFSRGGVVYLTAGSTEPVKSRRDQYNETMRQRREQYQETMRSRRDNYRSGTTPSPTNRGAPQQSAVQTAIGVKLDTKKLTEEINGVFIGAAKLLSGILNIPEADKAVLTTFSSNLKSVISQISQINIPPEIKFSMQPVQVNITGAQGLTDAANSLVDGAIQKAFIDFLSINDLNGTYKPPGEGE